MPDDLDRLRLDLDARVHRDTYAAFREGLDHRLLALQQRLDGVAAALERVRVDAETDLARTLADLMREIGEVRGEIAGVRTDRASAAEAQQRRRQWMIAGIVVPSLLAIVAIIAQFVR